MAHTQRELIDLPFAELKLTSSDWDPTKWIIWLLHLYTPFVPSIARTPESAIHTAQAKVHMAHADRLYASVPTHERVKPIEELPVWSRAEVLRRHGHVHENRRRVLLLVEGCIVDVGGYLDDHPGGQQLLLSHCVRTLPDESDADSPLSSPSWDASSPTTDSGYFSADQGEVKLKDATRAFFGGMNNHSGAAKEWMRCLRVARLEERIHSPKMD
jgi:stearoyl-CoA desaturase (delta-9 desaturase)